MLRVAWHQSMRTAREAVLRSTTYTRQSPARRSAGRRSTVSENEGDGTHGSLSGTDSEDELSDREDEYLSDLQKTLNRLKMERNKLLQENDEK